MAIGRAFIALGSLACLIGVGRAATISLAETRFVFATVLSLSEGAALYLAAFGVSLYLAGGARSGGGGTLAQTLFAVAAGSVLFALIGAGFVQTGAGGVLGAPAHLITDDPRALTGDFTDLSPARGTTWFVLMAAAALCSSLSAEATFGRIGPWAAAVFGGISGGLLFPMAFAWVQEGGWLASLGAVAPPPALTALWVGAVMAGAGRVTIGRAPSNEDGPTRRPKSAALATVGAVFAFSGLGLSAALADLSSVTAAGGIAAGQEIVAAGVAAFVGYLAAGGATALDTGEKARSLDGLVAGAVVALGVGDASGLALVVGAAALVGIMAALTVSTGERLGFDDPPRALGLIPGVMGAVFLSVAAGAPAALTVLSPLAQACAAMAVGVASAFALRQAASAWRVAANRGR